MAAEPRTTACAAPLELDAVLDVVLASAGRLFQGEGGSIMLLVAPEELEVVAAPTNAAALGARVRFGEGVAGKVAVNCDPVLVSGRAGRRSTPVDSGMCVPLVHEGRIFGVLNVNARPGHTFTGHDLVAGTAFASRAADALAAARLYEVERRDGALDLDRHLAAMLGHLREAVSVDYVPPGTDEDVDLAALSFAIADIADRDGRPTDVRGPSQLFVAGRRRELQRLLQELVDNAHRHGAPPVRLILEQVERAVGGAEVVLTVADDGPGVPVADRTRVFEPFGRLERASDGPGLGLGLAIARRLADAIGAGLTMTDTPVGGVAVRVTFPVDGVR
ncbi:MAG TPA: ATP-binding protein [Acidimicrobiales bacterium]|nr:ATP-binding protein [Acidimicrobiales bacterium]